MMKDYRRLMTALILPLAILALALPACAQPADEQGPGPEQLLAWAETFRYQGLNAEALELCTAVLDADRGNIEALLLRGQVLIAEDRLDEAQRDFNQAVKRQPKNALALVGRARVQLARDNQSQAKADAQKALKLTDAAADGENANADTWYARGVAKVILQNDTALQDFVMALSLNPALMDAHSERAHLYVAEGRRADALDQLSRAAQVRPDYAMGYLARARIHYEIGNLSESVADLDRALAINPQYARAWHNRGLINVERGYYREAINDLTSAIIAKPDYASAHVYRGQAYLEFDNPSAARADFERAMELDPKGWAGKTAADMLTDMGVEEPPIPPSTARPPEAPTI